MVPLLAALVALLVGLTIGKAWERYKLRDGTWIDRRRARAVAALHPRTQFSGRQPDRSGDRGVEPRGQPRRGRARSPHDSRQSVPGKRPGRQSHHRPSGAAAAAARLSKLEHAYVLLCLGLDYKRGGFVDRALEAFNEVLRLDPKNEYALLNLQKLHEEQHQWTEAYDTRQRLNEPGGDRRPAAEPGDSRVPRKRNRTRGDAAEGPSPKRSGGSRPRSISMPAPCRRT